jgi:phosphatidylglycerophosphatase A
MGDVIISHLLGGKVFSWGGANLVKEGEQRTRYLQAPIVIDEVVGQMIALWHAPRTWPWVLGGFLLFRLFDIWKPLGANQAQNLPGGWGIVADDVMAGIYAALVLQAFLLWGPFGR